MQQQASAVKGRLASARPAGRLALLPVAARPVRASRSSSRPLTVVASSAKFFVGGNWKCNGTVTSVVKLCDDLNAGSFPSGVDVVCAPPAIYLDYVITHLDKTRYQLAAQNCWTGKGGAFTGELSAEMLHDFGIPWVILGHSERRALLGESNETVGTKVGYALTQGLGVIACIGETLEQRKSGAMFNVLEAQMVPILSAVKDWSKVVIAYEPVWAIGTGVVASPEQAQEVHAWLRKYLIEKLGAGTADKLRIIYGGSVNDKNCNELAVQHDIDGFLVGGASLQGPAFVKICNSVTAKRA